MNKSNDLIKLNSQFSSEPFYTLPIDSNLIINEFPGPEYVHLFDHNGYDLTEIEKLYAHTNGFDGTSHRGEHHYSLKKEWFSQQLKLSGTVLNHCALFERKGFSGDALSQIKNWALSNPLLYKVINITPKWGIDFSMDYVGNDGEVFEVFHYEWDSFSYEDAIKSKQSLEELIEKTDWDIAAAQLKQRKKEWINLEFFSQSNWKCSFFGMPSERFKMVTWQN